MVELMEATLMKDLREKEGADASLALGTFAIDRDDLRNISTSSLFP